MPLSRHAGYYADTGFNTGKTGGRFSFLGFGVEYNLKAGTGDLNLCGAGIMMPTFKAKIGGPDKTPQPVAAA